MTTKKLKPFNLEAAKAGAAVITRDGREVRILCFDSKVECDNARYPIVALISDCDCGESHYSFTEYGHYLLRVEDPKDLFMAPTKITGYINIYPDYTTESRKSYIHETKVDADRNAATSRVACIKIEWDE